MPSKQKAPKGELKPAEFVFSEARNCFVLRHDMKEKRMKGLTKVLKSAFYPNYNWKVATEISRKKKVPKVKESDKLFKNSSTGRKLGGKALGSIVHEQMKNTVEMGWDEFNKTNPKIEPQTMWIWAWLSHCNLTPVIAELPVGFAEMGVATAVDMVCDDGKGGIVLVEWKTGMANTFDTYTGRMRGCVKDIFDNSPKNQAQLQMFMTKAMFEKTHGVKVSKCLIVRVSEKNISVDELDPRLSGMCTKIQSEMQRVVNKKSK